MLSRATQASRRQKKDESCKKEGKLRTAADIVVQKERGSVRSDTQQLRHVKIIQKKLPVTEEENRQTSGRRERRPDGEMMKQALSTTVSLSWRKSMTQPEFPEMLRKRVREG